MPSSKFLRCVAISCGCAGLLAAVGPAFAQSPAPSAEAKQIGTLTCTAAVPSADPQVPPEKETQFACTFEPIGAEGVKEYYVGSSTERLREIGPATKTLIAWSVHTEGKPAAPGSLEGTYAPNAGALVGGVQNAYTLRPLTAPDQKTGAPTTLESLVLRRDRPRV